ncbi:hypothetical protein HA402_013442 [Bradysia odoriphaga]|nr:hypothetical protein HA402_013442 [Bradysia odoriphaga]
MTQLPGRIWSSWGCVQALIVTLAILFLPLPASALEPGIDLLEALNLHNNHSQYLGVTITQGFTMKYAYRLSSDMKKRNLVLPMVTYQRAAEYIRRSADFTFTATVRQEQLNIGTIISFSHGENRYLELQSSGRKDQIRFHFQTTSNGITMFHEEEFSYRLADYTWHKVALSVSGTEIQLLIDCHPLYRRVIHYMPDRNFSASSMKLFVGQRDLESQFPFKGDIEEAHIIPGPYGYLKQCPHIEQSCPTCAQFSLLQDAIVSLQNNLIDLKQRLVDAEERVQRLESCDCKKSCKIDNVIRNDGEEWNVECTTCKCHQGDIKCGPMNCGVPKCKNPQPVVGECCPQCKKKCYINGTEYDDGEKKRIGCSDCTCKDGNMACLNFCTDLKCPPEQQKKIPGECCPYCPGEDYCSKGHACHTNATCLNLNTKYMCTCHPGFQGDGFFCSDIDECAQKGGVNGNHCHLNTKCINVEGGYVCECLPGYRQVDKFNCAEVNECLTGQHQCDKNAVCTNTQGSYECYCQDGYKGNGTYCEPYCEQPCLNGGHCSSPGVCTCYGFVGNSCEQDLDECATGLRTCNDSAVCVNMPGWSYCKCKPGYETHGNECRDINECYYNTHSCHPSAKCVNTEGHFECECSADDPSCRLSCMFEDAEIKDGDRVFPRNQPCKICTCRKGVISCEDQQCNCSTWTGSSGRDMCCPQCDPKWSCQHQELKNVVFKSGEQWIYQCQTCECLYGEFDCWKLECPPLTCDNPLPLTSGDCCQRCEDDPCRGPTNSTSGKTCTYKGHTYASGQSFSDLSSQCTQCACKDGRLCCNVDYNCTDDESRRPKSSTANVYPSNSYTTSKTTTPAISRRSKRLTTALVRRQGD